MNKTSKIEITFPTAVTFPDGFERALDALVGMVCEQYQREHPTEVMWPAGYGSKMLSNPLAMSDDEPLEFDDSVYAISVAARVTEIDEDAERIPQQAPQLGAGRQAEPPSLQLAGRPLLHHRPGGHPMNEQSRFTHFAEGIVFEPGRDLHWTAGDVTEDRVTHADALAAVAKLNEQAFGGFTDWRLPEVEELFLLADRTRYNPAIDTEFFPTCGSAWYWTATDDATDDVTEEKDAETGHSDYAWIVHFGLGGSYLYGRDDSLRVRAVRGPARQ